MLVLKFTRSEDIVLTTPDGTEIRLKLAREGRIGITAPKSVIIRRVHRDDADDDDRRPDHRD